MELETNTKPSTTPKPHFKRDAVYLIVIILLTALCGQFYYTYHYKPLAERSVDVFYNQDRQTNVELTRVITDADKFVYFAIYTFTRQDIADALLAAKHKGLDVRGIVDRKQSEAIESQKAIIKELQEANIPIVFNDHSYIMHIKSIVTDKAYVSGSYNWTASATDNNDEIIEIGHDEQTRQKYEATILEVIGKYSALTPN